MSNQSHFPQGNYTPFGYLDNPFHSAVLNRSGIIRSVPPLGMGFWVRDLPWPYGDGFGHRRIPNYLSFLHLSLCVGDASLHTLDDFSKNDIDLVSHYHTKLVMSYDFEFQNIIISAKYFLATENSVVCILDAANHSSENKEITLHATNIYGFPGQSFWGNDGLVSNHNPKNDLGVSKVWAYGDVMVIGANRQSVAHKALDSDEQWDDLISKNDLSNIEEVQTRFRAGGDHIYNVLSYQLSVPAGASDRIIISLTRGKNELWATNEFSSTVKSAPQILGEKLNEDARFYKHTPVLDGDWPDHWKHGWIYDIETIRMNIREPLGIYEHHWDAMQVHTPRAVLGEAALDSWCLSFSDMALAKDVMLGTFADAPMPNVPCSREDGSMNMICANGKECGTAPIWGLPFHVIRSMYLRDRDDFWIKQLYPYLKDFLEWWIEHRTDEEGWFHATCSWESGQDGSKRFLVDSHDPGAAAEFVRTVDIEAAMANAMNNMAFFAEIAGEAKDIKYWKRLADKRIKSTRSMYHDGWYRDVDARNNQPIILKNVEAFGKIQENYYDVMMLTPVALGISTPDQNEGIIPKFDHFKGHKLFWLEWPSFWQIFSEAAWNAGLRMFLSELVVDVGERTYERIDRRELLSVRKFDTGLPEKYNYRIPGVSMEFWPIKEDNPGGCENYGWGATFPTLVIRNVIGFREIDRLDKDQFLLAPALDSSLFKTGKTYSMLNLDYRGAKLDVRYAVLPENQLQITLNGTFASPASINVKDEQKKTVAFSRGKKNAFNISFTGENGALYTVTFN